MKIIKVILLALVALCAVFISKKYNFGTEDNVSLYLVGCLSYIAGTMINFFK